MTHLAKPPTSGERDVSSVMSAPCAFAIVIGTIPLGSIGRKCSTIVPFEPSPKKIGTSPRHVPHVKLRSFEGVVPKTTNWRAIGVT